jgi:putative hydrolase of the HAD superfamily
MSEMTPSDKPCLLFDWGDTLMRVWPDYDGPMATWPRVEALPHVVETLARLGADWRMALATNAAASEEGEIWQALARVGLDRLLDKVYCYRTIGHKKPSREFFDYILHDLKLGCESVFLVGDDFEADVMGANRCGIRAVWLNEQGDETRTGEMYRTIHDFRDLPKALAELWTALLPHRPA